LNFDNRVIPIKRITKKTKLITTVGLHDRNISNQIRRSQIWHDFKEDTHSTWESSSWSTSGWSYGKTEKEIKESLQHGICSY
jgi:hypothetical protein